jgi:sporulation integral membrane protein YlbJ
LDKSILKSAVLALIAVIMAAALILMPQESFEASVRGLNIWLEIVFPSLLPFLIIAEMLIAFGVVKFLGVFLEPLMRPLFKVPGSGGFVWAMGLASGNPSGAKLTARLRDEGQLTRIEAERLVSFTSSSNPLFIFGAVSVGFFNNAKLGILLGLTHYAANICVGLVMRFYGRKEEKQSFERSEKEKTIFPIMTALKSMHRTRLNDKRPIGKILGDAVSSSVQTLLMIGGFIIIFSVVNKLLFHLHITGFFASIISSLFHTLHIPSSLSVPFISGLFEITLGSQLTSQVTDSTLLAQAIIVSALLAFGGFSIQAQVASILAETDIRFKPFFLARLLHTLFAGIFTLILWKPVYLRLSTSESTSITEFVFSMESQGLSGTILNLFISHGALITILSLAGYTILLLVQYRKSI